MKLKLEYTLSDEDTDNSPSLDRRDNSPPKDRHFLVYNTQKAGDGKGNCRVVGFAWIEAWWDGSEYRIWCGNHRTYTSESLDFTHWTELPNPRKVVPYEKSM